jgi:hypothetical protein
MDELVQDEGVDLARVELGEALAHMFEQHSQLALVVLADQLASRPALGLVAALSGMARRTVLARAMGVRPR